MFSADLIAKAEHLIDLCRTRKIKIVSAESCTGGLVSGLITSIAGSSDVFERGFVTYSNEAKNESLGVAERLLQKYGAVSAEVARAMAEGALAHSHAHIAVSVTGVAGPGGGSVAKPVGLVHFGCGRAGEITTREARFGDLGRDAVRMISVVTAIDLLLAAV